MTGFPQSLNLSVSVAATLWALRVRELGDDLPGDLSSEQQTTLYDRWVRAHKGDVAEAALRHPSATDAVGKNVEELDEFRG
jgi:hypothetical protein